MKNYFVRFIHNAFIIAIWGLTTLSLSAQVNEQDIQQSVWTPKFGGGGGVFFDAKEGSLIVEIEKEDLKADSRTRILRAIFIGPDRKILQDIRTSENPAGDQFLRLETHVDKPGIYAVMVTVSNDRYGENTIWRFRTNCDKYMIETSRGHKDRQHEEPIILVDPEKETDLCFLPQQNGFDILLTGLSEEVETVELKDANDQHITFIKVNNDTAFHHVKEGERVGTPWKLHFPKAVAKIEIEGVTNWDKGSKSDYFCAYPEGALWTPNAENWFSLYDNRWLITPHSHTSYDQPGQQQSTVFKVHNNSTVSQKIQLKLEFPNEKWNVKLSHDEIVLKPNQKEDVILNWEGGNVDQSVHLRTTHRDFSTYSTLYSNIQNPYADSLQMPIILEPYHHEQEQFGYSPDYPTNNQPYFNIDNQPYILSENSVLSYQNDKWNEALTNRLQSSVVAFDSEGDTYVLARERDRTALLHSRDKGLSFKTYPLPEASGTRFDIEQFTGHNIIDGPPPVIKYTRTGADKKHFWRKYGNLELLIPKKTKGEIEWEQPILISDKCLGVSSHSGLPSSVVSYKDKVFIVWGEVTDVNISREEIPGVPVFVRMYNKKTKELTPPVLVGFGPPPNDTHNIPSITMDSEGFLHVLTGTHGRPFQYARSLQSLSINDGWTNAEPLLDPETVHSTQTYPGFVIDKENTLHTVFRYWQHNEEPFPETHYATLAYMSKEQGGQWSKPQILVQAPLSHYSNFRHRLTIDRKGRLFISYDYWSTHWFYRNDRKYAERTLLMSSDGGRTWKLVSGDDIVL